MVNDAQDILSSPYLSGVTQYGSSGVAHYAGYWVDSCTNPINALPRQSSPALMWYEIGRATSARGNQNDCPNPQQAAWAAAEGTSDASNSAIYVEVHYWKGDSGTTIGSYGGSNLFYGNTSTGGFQCGSGNCANFNYVSTR